MLCSSADVSASRITRNVVFLCSKLYIWQYLVYLEPNLERVQQNVHHVCQEATVESLGTIGVTPTVSTMNEHRVQCNSAVSESRRTKMTRVLHMLHMPTDTLVRKAREFNIIRYPCAYKLKHQDQRRIKTKWCRARKRHQFRNLKWVARLPQRSGVMMVLQD